MKKLLRPRDLLRIGLFGVLDIFEEAKDPFGVMASTCKKIYGWTPEKYKRHNFSRMVQRELKTGVIEKVVKGGEVYLRLTSEGKKKLVRDFPLFSIQNGRWDRKWRVVIFDILEISRLSRDSLRKKLKELGFGMLQESVWITPNDIALDFRDFLESKKLDEFVYVLEVSSVLAGDIRGLADRIWGLDDLNESYKKLLEELRELYIILHDRGRLSTVGRGKYEEKVRDIREEYLSLILLDPHLPKELLPEDWVGEKVKKEISKLKRFDK